MRSRSCRLQSRLSLTRTLPWATTGKRPAGVTTAITRRRSIRIRPWGLWARKAARPHPPEQSGRTPPAARMYIHRCASRRRKRPPAARSRRETLPIGTCVLPSRAGSKTGGSSACLALVLPEPTAVHRAIFWYGSMCCPPHLQRRPAAAPGKAKRRSCSVMPVSRRRIGKCISFRTRLWRSWG